MDVLFLLLLAALLDIIDKCNCKLFEVYSVMI